MSAAQGVLSAAERSVRSVFVGNIPYEATEEQLKDIFSEVGPVVSFRLVYDRETGKPKGYGFCEYKDQETALSAMRNLNAFDLNGRPLRVDNAASEKSKEELKNLQASLGGPPVESPYGTEVEPERAPEAISKAVASLPPEQMFELMKQMKLCIQNNPNEARNMLLQNPQLAYALLQAQVIMKIVEPQVALSILHRQNPTVGPLQPAPNAGMPQQVPQEMQPPPQFSQPMPNMAGGPAGFVPQAVPADPGFQDPAFAGRGVAPGRPALLGERPPVSEPGRPSVPFDPREQVRGGPLFDPRAAEPRMEARGDRDMRQGPPPGSMGDRDMRQPLEDQDLRHMGPPDPRFRSGAFDPRARGGGGPAPFGGGGPPPRDDPRFMPQRPPAPPVQQQHPRPGPNPVISPQDQEKAALIMQVLQLSDQQIALLPPDQRQSIMVLKEQIARSAQQ
ncbi:cleavage stimulation factor subunit 2 tau variant-like [Ornithodoros turicata]|uniref:Putative mrna cleavage and polyadenylation factor i complex subunit rna15 n=1 Tax=Ornithodoros turicata TaxID=34597 RepID=A0A2R5LN55_9ACAR